ncbi:MAG TPA: lytic transglycosylase domain-containing protein [Blastocatellia bacterium]|nr:lytic transglycosylase domain-containing protein [Blastocatellia bacterium]
MKLYRSVLSNLNLGFFKSSRKRKVVSTGSATLALGLSIFFFTGAGDRTLLDHSALSAIEVGATVEQAEPIAPRSLSRQRKDFDKALNLLADAAASNQKLAEYNRRVQKRITGEAFLPEHGSGVRVVNRASRNAASVKTEKLSANESTGSEKQKPGSMWARLKDYVGSPMEETQTAETAANADPRMPEVVAETSPAVKKNGSRLTVNDMAFEKNAAIDKWINWYTATQGGRRTMTIGIDRSSQYLEMARQEFRQAGLPEDLVWLAHVESVWHAEARSPAAAAGIWQFIPRTATDYGLTVEAGNDERFDARKQTRVAATYLRDLYTIFGDWALAMAAYNCGEPRVMEAVVKNGRANFWELHEKNLLPKETLNYVPKILAAITVAREAEKYSVMPASASGDDVAGL